MEEKEENGMLDEDELIHVEIEGMGLNIGNIFEKYQIIVIQIKKQSKKKKTNKINLFRDWKLIIQYSN